MYTNSWASFPVWWPCWHEAWVGRPVSPFRTGPWSCAHTKTRMVTGAVLFEESVNLSSAEIRSKALCKTKIAMKCHEALKTMRPTQPRHSC